MRPTRGDGALGSRLCERARRARARATIGLRQLVFAFIIFATADTGGQISIGLQVRAGIGS
eukprot:8872196-Pyramimonas_sp.AAC.1